MFLAAFLPAALVVYALTPTRWRWATLLAASYVFFFALSGRLLGFLVVSTASVYLLALWMDRLAVRRDESAKGLERAERRSVKARYARYMAQALEQSGDEQQSTWNECFDIIAENVPLYPVVQIQTVTASWNDPSTSPSGKAIKGFSGIGTTSMYFLNCASLSK